MTAPADSVWGAWDNDSQEWTEHTFGSREAARRFCREHRGSSWLIPKRRPTPRDLHGLILCPRDYRRVMRNPKLRQLLAAVARAAAAYIRERRGP